MSQILTERIIAALWLAWLAYWIISARGLKATRWREPLARHLVHRVPVLIAVWLLFPQPFVPVPLREPFISWSTPLGLLGAVIVALGLGFAIWARRYLGTNWSSTVTLKEDHALVRGGPYKFVRHPIYTGVLFALLGTAIVTTEWRGLVALPCAFIGFFYKSRQEEKKLQEIFPDYSDYRHSTAALIPFVF